MSWFFGGDLLGSLFSGPGPHRIHLVRKRRRGYTLQWLHEAIMRPNCGLTKACSKPLHGHSPSPQMEMFKVDIFKLYSSIFSHSMSDWGNNPSEASPEQEDTPP